MAFVTHLNAIERLK